MPEQSAGITLVLSLKGCATMIKTFLKWFIGLFLLATLVPSFFLFFWALSQTGVLAAAFAAFFWGMIAMPIILFNPALVILIFGLIVCAIASERGRG